MGPTNVALVKLFRADQSMREAQERLDSATKSLRVQERKTNDLAEKLKLAQSNSKDLQVKSANLDLDLKTRDAHIEKLRSQQQVAKNNKEYQAFLLEISAGKADRAAVEEQAIALLGEVEKAQKEASDLAASVETERAKLVEMKGQMSGTVSKLTAEIEALRGPRDAAAATMSPKARDVFNRLAEHHEGEALSAVMKPDRRKEEYACSACMIDLVADVYNKLHTRDEIVFCPSCRRILYIPDDLPPELAVHKKKSTPAMTSADGTERPKEAPRARGRIGDLLAAAQGESVKNAMDAGQNPHEYQISVDGKIVGVYKGKTAENLERIILFRMEEAGEKHEVHLIAVHHTEPVEAEAGTQAPTT
jgi:uncharacterized protein